MRPISLSVMMVFFFGFPPSSFGQNADSVDFFEKKVRPALLENCSQCHNAKTRTAGLDLTSVDGIITGPDSGPLISKEKPSQSMLLKVVGYQEKMKMPPAGKLPAGVLQDLDAWVKAGAKLPDAKAAPVQKTSSGVFSSARTSHWAFQPVRTHVPPEVKNTDWGRTAIDRFILAKLEEKGIAPPKAASKITLIRRAKYDLLGLPPTEDEIRDFLADTSSAAFAKLVDRYLASPQYGEKWGRHWLDVARYAETCGVDDNDAYTDAWRYREYVIDAFNRDVPYDRMVRSQIAGDLLPSEDGSPVNAKGRVATGFLALGPKATVEMDKMKTAYDVIDEQIDTTSKAFLGLTVACARCHDHKFDPIATKDYYSMAAIFANTKTFDNQKGDFFTERKSKLYMAPLVDQAVYEKYRAHQQKITAKNMQASALIDNEVWKHEATNLFPRLADYMVAAWKVQSGKGDAKAVAEAGKLNPQILEAWVKYLDPKAGFRPHLQRWREAGEANVAAIAAEYQALFDKTAVNWAVELANWKLAVDAANRGERELPKAPNIEYNSKTAFTDPSERFFAEIVIPAKTFNDRSSKDGPFVLTEKDQEDAVPVQAKEQLAALRKQSEELTKTAPSRPPMANAVGEGQNVEQHVFLRGNYSSPGELVHPAVLTVMKTATAGPMDHGSGRKELADFLASPSNPLTPRVMVNRLWLWHFGEGIVRTPNNFGLAGEAPTHPELLDYLATEFMKSGWSMKSMHRAMMLTSLYQSDSTISEEANRQDAANRLWSRFQRRRMTVEEMRDTWLTLSGDLQLKMGGIFDQVDADASGRPGRGMKRAESPRSFDISTRRTVYVSINRTAVATPMVLYDFVDSSTSAGDRPETVIAPQALYLMNNAFVQKNASAFAGRLLADKEASDEDRVRKAYGMAWQREPDHAEVESALRYIREYPSLQTPAKQTQAGQNQEFGGWQSLCRILISANQFYYID